MGGGDLHPDRREGHREAEGAQKGLAGEQGQAARLDVAAEATVTHLRLRVTDDGRGIDPTRARRSGLANLHARATELGGTLTLTPRRPTGTTLEWTVPLPAGDG